MNHISDKDLAVVNKERFSVPDGDLLTSSDKAAKHVTAFLGDGINDRERFVVLLLNARNQLMKTVVLFEGSLTASVVYPGQVAKVALKENSAAVIIGHNHPSGNLNPSNEDRIITLRIKDALKTVDLSLHDHVIVVPGGDYYSFAGAGIL